MNVAWDHRAEEELEITDDDGGDAGIFHPPPVEPWRVMIVDDDEIMHRVTTYTLRDLAFEGRPIQLLHAYTGAEACRILAEHNDIACILLDVVMETEDAGLRVVPRIREELGNHAVRIILRTGQPGHAPEMEVVERYDINDYKHKGELTGPRLVTTVVAACRSYQQLRTNEINRRGLQRIIDGAPGLLGEHSVSSFAGRVLTQLCNLLEVPGNSVFVLRRRELPVEQAVVLQAIGTLHPFSGLTLAAISDATVQRAVTETLRRRTGFDGDGFTAHFYPLPSGSDVAVLALTSRALSEVSRSLVTVFSTNIAVGLENALLFEQVERLAFFDALTGLPNRTSFLREVARRAAPNGRRFAVILADIDGFHAVSSGLGFETGDSYIRRATAAIAAIIPPGDTYFARIGVDFFGIITNIENDSDLDAMLQRLRAVFSVPFIVDGKFLTCSITSGAAAYPDHASDCDTLFRRADVALRKAKSQGRARICVYSPGMADALSRRIDVINRLQDVLARRGLTVHYQPQVDLLSRRIKGAEALVRWPIDDKKFIPPGDFIPAAEDSGLIVELGAWVLQESCRQQHQWHQAINGIAPFVAVNISPVQLRQADFPSVVARILAETGIKPDCLELELTETAVMEDLDQALDTLTALKTLGVRLALDDFGTGYSSLSRLQRMPIDTLKIDRSFITQVTERQESRALANMIVAIGHLLGKLVVAEGLETGEQADMLAEIGCDLGQGYHFCRPLPPSDVLAMFR